MILPGILLAFILVAGSARTEAQGAMEHMHPSSQEPTSGLPGAASEKSTQQPTDRPTFTLESLERMALENNPTLRQASAEIRAAEGRRLQAGLFPNPRVGYTGEEIKSGSSRGGQQGFFVEQEIVLGGKLGLGRKVFEQEVRLAELEADEQRHRVLNAVKLGFYQVLASQEMSKTLERLAQIAWESADTAKRLANIGQMDATEVLKAEIEGQQADLAVLEETIRAQRLWTALASVVGVPNLPATTLEGSLEEGLPMLDQQATVNRLITGSPAMKIAEANVMRSDALLARERREAIPNLQLRGGIQSNRELMEPLQRPIGAQGFAEIGVQIPIFNRNQGTVEAARAAHDRAEAESSRLRLVLRERAAAAFQQYNFSRERVERYRMEILPRAENAYDLMLKRWGQMAASYPMALSAQRMLAQAQTDYISSLASLWESSIALQGFLLTDGLEAPSRPGEVDMPVREGNLPILRGTPAGRD